MTPQTTAARQAETLGAFDVLRLLWDADGWSWEPCLMRLRDSVIHASGVCFYTTLGGVALRDSKTRRVVYETPILLWLFVFPFLVLRLRRKLDKREGLRGE